MNWNDRAKDAGLACLSAVLLVLAFPSWDLEEMSWIGLAPLLIALEGKRLKEAFVLSSVTGMLLFPGICSWIWSVDEFNGLDFTILAAYLSLYISLWGLALTWVRQRTHLPAALVAPPLWVTLEYIRSHLWLLGAPWMLLGHSQYLHLPLIQISAVTGAYGLSFVIVLVNVVITDLILYGRRWWSRPAILGQSRRFPLFSLATAGVLLLAIWLYGVSVLANGREGKQISLALVQGNIPQGHKWQRTNRQEILDQYAKLTRAAAQHAPTLIIWPETAVPGDVQHEEELRQQVGQIAIEAKTPLLVGSGEKALFTNRRFVNRYYNTMVLFSPKGRIEGQYRKVVLVPFGEYVPLRDVVSWPEAVAATMGDYLPGDRYTLFTMGQETFGAVICWELIFPDLFREFVKRGAHFMVIATNEAWFGATAAPYQLLAMSVFRAAENRTAIARAANTGVSAFIDPYGRITNRLTGAEQQDLFIAGVLIARLWPFLDSRRVGHPLG